MARIRLVFPITLGLCCAACGDPEVGPGYKGESLLSLKGSVTMEESTVEGPLVPALAFENSDRGRLDIVDVESTGQFPANFSLVVHSPPPEEAFMEGFNENEPRLAFGYITAVAADHVPFVPYSPGQSLSGSCDGQYCYEELEACTSDGTACYRESRRCDLEEEHNCEVVSSEGDPSLLESPFRDFAGLSQNYQVIYLEKAAPAASITALTFGGGKALAAGYHLLEVRLATEDEIAAQDACRAQVERDVLAPYNAAHGTAFQELNELGAPCQAEDSACVQAPQPPLEDIDGLWEQFDQLMVDHGCIQDEEIYIHIDEPASRSISVHIAHDVGPFNEEDSDPSFEPLGAEPTAVEGE